MTKIALVGGTGRSGTTIVNEILGCHPNVVVSPPWRFMIDPDGVLDFINASAGSWSPYEIDIRIKRLKAILQDVSKPTLPGWLLKTFNLRELSAKLGVGLAPRYAHINAEDFCAGFGSLTSEFLQEIIDFSYTANWVGTRFLEYHRMNYASPFRDTETRDAGARFYQGVVDRSLEQHDATTFIDRNTWNHLKFDQFLKLDDSIKLLHVYRDPRDVVASYINQNWMPQNPLEAARTYQDLTEAWWQVRERVPQDSFLEFSLEDLVNDPKGMLGRVCDFLGLPWDDALLSISLAASNTGRWRTDIPKQDQNATEQMLAKSLEHWGYS